MRESHTEQNPALLSGSMPYAYAGSRQDPLPVQRFSISEVHSNAGNPMYLPFERQLHKNQHPCASRLRPSARLGASTNQTVPVNSNSVRTSSAAQDHTEATFRPLSYPSHNPLGHQAPRGTCVPCCWLSAAEQLGIIFYYILAIQCRSLPLTTSCFCSLQFT